MSKLRHFLWRLLAWTSRPELVCYWFGHDAEEIVSPPIQAGTFRCRRCRHRVWSIGGHWMSASD